MPPCLAKGGLQEAWNALHIFLCSYLYIYIYIYRERDFYRDMICLLNLTSRHLLGLSIWGLRTLWVPPTQRARPRQAADAAAEAAGSFATRLAVEAGLTLEQVAEEARDPKPQALPMYLY